MYSKRWKPRQQGVPGYTFFEICFFRLNNGIAAPGPSIRPCLCFPGPRHLIPVLAIKSHSMLLNYRSIPPCWYDYSPPADKVINLRACWLKSDADKGCKPLLSLRLWTVNKGACKVISLYKTLPKLKKALFYYVFPLFLCLERQEITKQGDKNSGVIL